MFDYQEDVLLKAERESLLREARSLAEDPKATKQTLKRADVLLAQASNLKSRSEMQVRAAKAAGISVTELITNESRTSTEAGMKAFRQYLRDGDRSSPELRTAFDESVAGAFIPAQWAAQYVSRLTSFSGIREAGATVVTTATSAVYHDPYLNDAANTGERLAENSLVSLANPLVSESQIGAFRYGSKGVQISNELVNDIGYDLDAALQSIFAKRVGRVTNTEFTLGAAGGPVGVIPTLTNIVTAAGATSVTLTDLNAVPALLDYGYRQPEENPCWMFSAGVETLLKNMTASGLRVFPEMADNKQLLGYPYVVNVDMPSSFTANAKAIAFGSFKRGVTIRQVTPILTVSKERYVELYLSYYSLIHRQSCVVSDGNAIALLQMAAS